MAIYTKTGDKGITSLFDGQRISKASLRVDAYGTLDELNVQLSVCEKLAKDEGVKDVLRHIQHLIFSICAEIASKDISSIAENQMLIGMNETKWLEELIDRINAEVPSVHNFILNGRYLSAAELHVGRTVCRRAERLLIALSHEEIVRTEVLTFVNRLSDGLYMLARKEDTTGFIEEAVNKIYTLYMDSTTAIPGSRSVKKCDDLESLAFILCNRAREKAEELLVPIVVSVVDDKGVPVLFYRMENALIVSNELAPSKAYTAVAFKCPTHQLGIHTQPGADLYQIESMVKEKIVTFGGGYPIMYKTKLLGGLGISGGTVEEDMAIAEYALSKVEVCDGKC